MADAPAFQPSLTGSSPDMVLFSSNIKTDVPYIMRKPAELEDVDEYGFVKAGPVLKLIDVSGSIPALRHLNTDGVRKGSVVTASLDRTDFREPIRAWEMIRLDSRITQVWKSSMETQVKVMAEEIYTGKTREVATAHLVFVALDPDRKKMSFPAYSPKTYEERAMAKAADLRKANRQAEGKSAPMIPIDASDNPVTISKPTTSLDANGQSNVFGGVVLSVIDEAGSTAAKRQALSGHVVGVRQDRMSFIAPSFIGETLEAKSVVTKTWGTSMEVQVEVEAVNPNTGTRRKVASSYLVYVKLGANSRPAEVPPFEPATELQKKRAESADLRRQIREDEEKEADIISATPASPKFWKRWLARITGNYS